MVRANTGVSRLTWALLAATLPALPLVPGMTSSAMAQQDTAEKSPRELIEDFTHFVRIGQYDAAAGAMAELRDRGISNTEFVDLIDRSGEYDRFREMLTRAMQVGMLEELAATLDQKYKAGKLERVRSPDEVARNIRLLDEGTLRARQIARQRLMAAGEYAMPQLMETYLANANPNLKAQVQQVMVDMGRQAIMPLVAALPGLDPARQEALVEVLGQIPYRTSLPYIVRLNRDTDVQSVRDSTAWAIGQLGGRPGMDVADLFYSLAEAYYDERSELTSFPDERNQLLWDYEPAIGLIPTPVLTEAFHEAMAMRTVETSLRNDASSPDAVALWIAANYSRELDSPEGYANPAYPPERRDAEYFAVAAGSSISQIALARALDDRDTPLARRTIAAIEMTAGGQSLWGGTGARRPLLEAVGYQNRRVQYEAALALGKAQPLSPFDGSDRVVPLLASAVRDAAARYAVVLTGDDREEYERHRGVLEDEGYTVLPPSATGLGELRGAIAEAPGIDLMITSLTGEATRAIVDEARSDPKLGVTPVLAMVSPDEMEYFDRLYRRDQTVMVRRVGIDRTMFRNATESLIETASGGPIAPDEAADYADRSLAVLRDLAVSQNPVLDVNDAAAPLIAELAQTEGVVMLDIGEVLAHVPQQRAQSALMNRALELSGGERLAMLNLVADSGKRFGRMLDERQVRRLVELAKNSDYTLATQAAAVMGAMNLPNDSLLPLMFGDDGDSRAVRARNE